MERGKHSISSTRWEVAASNFKLVEWRHLKEICEVTKGSNCESRRKTVHAGKTEGDRRMKCLLTPGFTTTRNRVQVCKQAHVFYSAESAHTVESGALAWFTWRCTKQNLHFIHMHVPCSIFHSCLSCCKNGFSYSAYIVNSVISVWLNLYSNCNWMYLKCICSARGLGCGVGYDWLRRRWEFLPRLETPR